jgi:hypothetical protein
VWNVSSLRDVALTLMWLRGRTKGIRKFVAFDIPIELAKQRYANHFVVVAHDVPEKDDLRLLGIDGQHAFQVPRWRRLHQVRRQRDKDRLAEGGCEVHAALPPVA